MKQLIKNIVYFSVEKIILFFCYKKMERGLRRYLFGKDVLGDFVRKIAGIDEQGRVRIEHLEVDIVKGCNLKCKFCTHLSPYRHGYIPFQELEEWFKTWSYKLIPDHFDLLGREPLLHPEIDQVILAASKYWKDSQIHLVTNGMILCNENRIKKSMIGGKLGDALKQANAVVYISKHYDNDEYNKKFNESLECLEMSGVPFIVRPSLKKWWIPFLFA
jgi:hypothetical protein